MKWVIAPIAWPLMLVGLIGAALWMAAGGDQRILIEKSRCRQLRHSSERLKK